MISSRRRIRAKNLRSETDKVIERWKKKGIVKDVVLNHTVNYVEIAFQ